MIFIKVIYRERLHRYQSHVKNKTSNNRKNKYPLRIKDIWKLPQIPNKKREHILMIMIKCNLNNIIS